MSQSTVMISYEIGMIRSFDILKRKNNYSADFMKINKARYLHVLVRDEFSIASH